jgi:hypothetical protein
VVFGIGFAAAVAIPGAGSATAKDMTDYYNSDGRMVVAGVLTLCLLLGCLAMIWFFNELNDRLNHGMLTRVAFSLAMIGIICSMAGLAVMVGPTAALQGGPADAKFVGVDAAFAFAQVGLLLVLGGAFTAFALASLLYTIAAMRLGAIAKPFYIACYVLFVITLGSFFWIPGYGFIAWVAVMGIGTYVRSEAVATSRVAAPERVPA